MITSWLLSWRVSIQLDCADALRKERNVLLLTTSNLTGAIDRAFLDRVDMQLYVGPPGPRAAHHILHSILRELTDKQVKQCSGSESGSRSTGSTCFWGSRIRIRIQIHSSEVCMRIRILLSVAKIVRKTLNPTVLFCDFSWIFYLWKWCKCTFKK
jgi:SpoVK/Ycf46/Vps4 family AAA+-type ATPase